MAIRIETKDHCIEFGVTELPNRKSQCLYQTRGAMIEVLAYFRNDQCADEFRKTIDFIYKLLEEKKKTIVLKRDELKKRQMNKNIAKCPNCGAKLQYYHSSGGITRAVCKKKCQI